MKCYASYFRFGRTRSRYGTMFRSVRFPSLLGLCPSSDIDISGSKVLTSKAASLVRGPSMYC